ncbi:MAG: FtsH protease activity modulator HflK [Gammaproteobacteria bacterium]|nr:FtsH protease activity modulator HflK [Gammaproteobacteria bacterium]
MAWNEPGNQKPDPWGRKNNDGPPDLEAQMRKWLGRLGGVFGGRGGNGGSQSGGEAGAAGFGLIAIVALLIWSLSGFYTVQEAERGVVMRFGAYHETVTSGIHWLPRFVDKVITVDVSKVVQKRAAGRMLTQDENIAEVELGVQYRISDPVKYLFNVRDPDRTMEHVAESALRLVVGQSSMDDLLTGGRDQVRIRSEEEMNRIIEPYQTGLVITEVTLQVAKAPNDVQASFDDAIKAREDEERVITEARTYSSKQEPIAEGRASRIVQEAQAYKQEVVARAQGEVARFVKLLPQYELAPEVTRKRLYLETMQDVLSNSSKVLVDVEGGSNMMYLPLDKIIGTRPGYTPRVEVSPLSSEPAGANPASNDPYLNSSRR